MAAAESYDFQSLSHLRALRDLVAQNIRPSRIQASVAAMQRVSGMANPLLHLATAITGSRVVFRHAGAMVEPISRQLVFDFEAHSRMRCVSSTMSPGRGMAADVSTLFLEAVRCEEGHAPRRHVMALYEQILELQPDHAPACINLGTIHYNMGQYGQAETMYRRATEADPQYALAFFDLGNVLDEVGRLPEAIAAYKRALALVPEYADAHYNLALAYERQGETRRALAHWARYAHLDPESPWGAHARAQAQKALNTEPLRIVYRREWS